MDAFFPFHYYQHHNNQLPFFDWPTTTPPNLSAYGSYASYCPRPLTPDYSIRPIRYGSPPVYQDLQGRMNEKIPPPSWSLPGAFRSEHSFNYEEHCQRMGGIPSNHTNFDMEVPAVRTAQSFVPPFLPRFGIQFTDFDYRINEFPRTGIFGCPFGAQIQNHSLAHSLNLNAAMQTPNAISDNISLPTNQRPPILANQSTPVPPLVTETEPNTEKPPILSVEFTESQAEDTEVTATFVEKSSDKIAMRPMSPTDRENPQIPQNDTVDSKPAQPPLFDHKTFFNSRINEEFLFGTQFYPSTVPIDVRAALLKKETPVSEINQEEKMSPNVSKREYNPIHDCQVCMSTHANGLHFGARTCAACAAFFRRTISDEKRYVCKRNQRCHNASRDGTGYRKICRSCRMKRCLEIGMLPENVQHKRTRNPNDSPHRRMSFDSFFPPFPYQNIDGINAANNANMCSSSTPRTSTIIS